ncbi:putative uncharacterized protein C7orf78 homolog [Genypterus blacodes]|uniref:putative uncharacterized protein C7orf78 homolog n=1 Tax=Genypterus blacodes TaxID=154954 RepID=UPI003F776F41
MSLLQPPPLVSFERKLQFSASQDLTAAKSKRFSVPVTESSGDVWSIKPPDFSLKLYTRLSDPQKTKEKKKKKNTGQESSLPKLSETKWRTLIFLPRLSHECERKTEPPAFIAPHRPPDALQSELMFVRKGKYPLDPYMNPKPHDFRPLDEDVPDFVTTYERDPGNLRFKLKHMDTVQTTRSESYYSPRVTRGKLDTCKPAEPQWEARLTLPKVPWPPKSASYTRHRRRRGVYSAFLDRAEEKLCRSWEKR